LRAGLASLEAGDVQDAISALARACAKEPRNALAHLQLARALLASGQRKPADLHLRHAAALAPFFPKRRVFAGQLWLWQHSKYGSQEALVEGLTNLRAAIARDAGVLDDALALLREHAPRHSTAHLAQLIPSDRPDLRRRIVRDLVARKKTLGAIRLLAPLAHIDEAAPEDLLTWAQLHLDLGSAPPALAAYLRAIPPLEPRARRQALAAACAHLVRAKRPDDAVELATRVAEAVPGDARVQAELGSALLAAHRYSEASDALERAVAGGHPASGVQLGHTLLRLGRTRSAIEAWQQTLPSLRQPASYVSLALELRRLLLREGREDEAETVLSEALRRFPADGRLNKAAEAE
jgi:tetratricopeptide (TPR) repeat protein